MKRKVKFVLSFVLFMLVSYSIYGLNLSVLVVQKNGTEKISESTKIFENQILNTLFDMGHIVSNEPIAMYENYLYAQDKAIEAALDGFIDFYIEVIVEYDIQKSTNPEGVTLDNIKSVEYEIKNVFTGKVLHKSSKIFPENVYGSTDFVSFNKFACKIADNIILNIDRK